MKKICKVILAAVAIAALAVPAMAADKLIVRNATNTADAFKVLDDGTIVTGTGGFYYDGTTKRAGFGTSSPDAALSATSELTVASRGLVVTHHSNNAAGSVGVFRKTRGTEASKSGMLSGDYIGTFGFYPYDGTSYLMTGWFGAVVRGTVSTGVAPTEIFFCNGSTSISNCYSENKVNMLISATGNVGIGSQTPTSKLQVVGLITYTSNALAIAGGLTPGAFYTDGTGNVKVVY